VELKNILIEPTPKTPQIDLNHITGELIFSGRSIPENAAGLYSRVLEWINEYVKNPRETTNLRFNLDYFNTTSSIWLAKIIKSLCSINNTENTLFIHIYFDIDEYDNMEVDDLKDAISPVFDMITTPNLSLGIKIYGRANNGEIVKESIVFV
jgi:hypothetical protein